MTEPVVTKFDPPLFLMIKPHAMMHAGGIIAVLQYCAFDVEGIRTRCLSPADIDVLYGEHHGKEFWPRLVKSVTGLSCGIRLRDVRNPVLDHALARLRRTVGATDPKKAISGTIRYQFGLELPHNAVHASDSAGRIIIESDLFFGGAR